MKKLPIEEIATTLKPNHYKFLGYRYIEKKASLAIATEWAYKNNNNLCIDGIPHLVFQCGDDKTPGYYQINKTPSSYIDAWDKATKIGKDDLLADQKSSKLNYFNLIVSLTEIQKLPKIESFDDDDTDDDDTDDTDDTDDDDTDDTDDTDDDDTDDDDTDTDDT